MHIGIVTRSQVDYALDMANELIGAGMFVTLYMDYAETVEEVGDPGRPVERLFEVGLLPPTCRVRLLRLPRMRDPRSFGHFHKLKNIMYEDGVELAHILLNDSEIWFAFLPCLLNNLPVATTMIVPVANVGGPIPAPMVWVINKLAVYGSEMVIVNGAEQVEFVKRLYRIPANRIVHLPLSMHTRAIKWRIQKVPEEPGTILFFGRAHPHKGLEYLVRAQPLINRKVPHARILISAHGKDLERCRQLIRDQSKFEINEGVVSGNVMADLFQRASLVALPYLTASTSGVLLTAYSFAKPVVASRVGCLTQYVEDGVRGLLVTPSNIEELVDAIVRLLSDDSLRHRMGTNAESWVRERQKEITMRTLSIYEKAISLHQGA
jgi:glycosyltransferase involved in cell wall biosynthesis